MIRTILMITWMLYIFGSATAQKYPANDFIPPLDVPLKLSGTFGELRSNHFHSGIDLKTGEMEGLRVYAIADGFISRIKVQSGAYGKALYITHPNGYVSVYAHLSKFNTPIDNHVIQTQYNNQSYEIDIYPPADQFPVSQGNVVAFSGNSGRSGGPHLHFEIRSEADQKPINPLLFNFAVTDKTAPQINMIKVYPQGKKSRVEHSSTPKDFIAIPKGSVYALKDTDTITAAGPILFGINTYDPFYGGLNKNGVYTVQLFVDDQLAYGHKLESFSFDETRYINSFIDYKEYKTQNRRVQKSHIDPNNKLSIYTTKNHDGLQVNEGALHQVRYEVSDFAGNTSKLIFWVRGVPLPTDKVENKGGENWQVLSYSHNNTFRTSDLELSVPANALYDTVTFMYSRLPLKPGTFSAVHRLHYDHVPLHTWCQVTISPEGLDETLASRALIVKLEKNGKLTPCGGTLKERQITARIREFGDYCIMADTVPPRITPVNIYNNKSLLAQNTIRMKIADELSGIRSYNAYLDGRWILMEYDEKNDLLTYHFDQHLNDGENVFELIVTDERDNRAHYKTTLVY